MTFNNWDLLSFLALWSILHGSSSILLCCFFLIAGLFMLLPSLPLFLPLFLPPFPMTTEQSRERREGSEGREGERNTIPPPPPFQSALAGRSLLKGGRERHFAKNKKKKNIRVKRKSAPLNKSAVLFTQTHFLKSQLLTFLIQVCLSVLQQGGRRKKECFPSAQTAFSRKNTREDLDLGQRLIFRQRLLGNEGLCARRKERHRGSSSQVGERERDVKQIICPSSFSLFHFFRP